MAKFSAKAVIWIIIFVMIVIGFIALMGGYAGVFGPGFFLPACEGDVDAVSIWSSAGRTFYGYQSPRCTIWTTEEKCRNIYEPIKLKFDETEKEVCRWLPKDTMVIQGSPGDASEPTPLDADKCLLAVGCEFLSEIREPKCSSVPRCQPVSIFKQAVYSLKQSGSGLQMEKGIGGGE